VGSKLRYVVSMLVLSASNGDLLTRLHAFVAQVVKMWDAPYAMKPRRSRSFVSVSKLG
jgi:hypothetical protein